MWLGFDQLCFDQLQVLEKINNGRHSVFALCLSSGSSKDRNKIIMYFKSQNCDTLILLAWHMGAFLVCALCLG